MGVRPPRLNRSVSLLRDRVNDSHLSNRSSWKEWVGRGGISTIGLSLLAACSGHLQPVTEPDRRAETQAVYTSGGGYETTLIPVTFAGRFVFQGADGALKTLENVHVKRQDRAHWKPERVDLGVDAEGNF